MVIVKITPQQTIKECFNVKCIGFRFVFRWHFTEMYPQEPFLENASKLKVQMYKFKTIFMGYFTEMPPPS